MFRRRHVLLSALLLTPAFAAAEPVRYEIDPAHTYPSFAADHMGISVWRGKINDSRGTVTLDKAAGTGEVDITMDVTSIDFGLDDMNRAAHGEGLFDLAAHPTATYRGRLVDFVDGEPTRVDGELTLNGITRAVPLEIRLFGCLPHPLHGRELCGADAHARIDRSQFGMDAGKDYGFDMGVDLAIQVEAVAVAADGAGEAKPSAD